MFQCPDALASCLSGLQNANPLQILAAQSAVVEAMERHWYSRYIASWTVEEKKNEKETGEEDEQKQTKKAPICVEHTVLQTCMDIIGVCTKAEDQILGCSGYDIQLSLFMYAKSTERSMEDVCSGSDQLPTRPHES